MAAKETPLADRLQAHFRGSPTAGLVSVYLFGSQAEGRAHDESDIDIAVVFDRQAVPTSRERFDLRVKLISDLIGALHHNEIDVVVLNDVPPLFARRVLYEGIEVYCRERDREIDFRRDVQLRAADLQPFLDKYDQIKLEALGR